MRIRSPREYPSEFRGQPPPLEALTTPPSGLTSQAWVPGSAAPGQLGPELRLLTQYELGTERASQVFDELKK